MKRARIVSWLVVVVVGSLAFACSGGKDSPPPAAEPKEAPRKAPPPAPPPAPEPEPEPAAPEPSTPEEIELARKAAMMEGRDQDAIKYCELAGIEADKSDPQALLGCTLAACRVKDMDKARAWSRTLPKALAKEAKKICRANGAPI